MNLTRTKAGHYIYGAKVIKRNYDEDKIYWTITEGDKVVRVENLARARELIEQEMEY
jgi:hypothetical protein